MGSVIRVNHPSLTLEERNNRMEQIKEASIKFYKKVNKRKAANESEDEYVKGFHDR